MTVASTTQRVTYAGNGATTTFAIPFSYPGSPYTLASSEVEVYTRDASTTPATETLKVNPTHYTISGTNVVFGTAPASGISVLIRRIVPLTQSLDLITNGNPAPDDQEAEYDRLMMALQQQLEQINRAPKFQKTSSTVSIDLPEPSASAVLQWNSGATAIENGPTAAQVSGAQTYAAAASASATAAAGSASAAATSAAAALVSQTAAATSATNAATSATSAATSAASALAAAAVVISTHSAPTAVVAGTGIASPSAQKTRQYIQGSGGAVDITANPQIGVGAIDGQELILVGCSNTNTVLLETGTGLIMNGSCTMNDGTILKLGWDAGQSLWVEEYRNGL